MITIEIDTLNAIKIQASKSGILNLYQKGLGPEDIELVSQILTEIPNIHTIYLSNNILGAEGMAKLAAVLMQKNSLNLQNLYLANCELGEAGAEILANLMAIHPGLRQVDVRLNDIGPDGGNALVAVLEANKRITKFHIKLNLNIGDEVASKFAILVRERLYLAPVNISPTKLAPRTRIFVENSAKIRNNTFNWALRTFLGQRLSVPISSETPKRQRLNGDTHAIRTKEAVRSNDDLVEIIFSYLKPNM